jgi:hypothetical protein
METKNKENKQKKINRRKFFVIFSTILIGISLVLTPTFLTHIVNGQNTTTYTYNDSNGQVAVATNSNSQSTATTATTNSQNTDNTYKYTGIPLLDEGLTAINNFGNSIINGLTGWITDGIYTMIGKLCWGISYVIAYVAGVAIAVETWLIGAILNINAGVFNTAVVQMGFSVSLSLANLGFIIGIIIIAIATIIQNQTYGMKQILWKLVFMAILVNFGLVIMGAIFNVSNQFTNYFLNCIDPSGSGCSGNEDGLTSSNNFAKHLAGAFNPQRDFFTNNVESNDAKDVPGATGSGLGQMLVPITSMLFVVTAVILIVIVLGAFIVMLVVRYVYIAILAVLLPFAWMLWIFPSTKKNFSDWWEKFIKWTIFAPIVLFFLWLAMETATGLSSNSTGTQHFAIYKSDSNPVWAAVSNLFTNTFSPMIQALLDETVLVGLMIGGMIAADKLSITGAKEALGAMKNVGNAAKGYAVKGMKKGANTAIHKNVSVPFTKGKKKFSLAGGIDKMQTSKIPGVSALGRELSSQTDNLGKGLVDREAENAKKLDSGTIAKQLQGSMGKEQQLAYLKTLADRGDLDKVSNINGQGLGDFMNNKDLLNRYGQQGLGKTYDIATMNNSAMREAQEAIKNGKGDKPITIGDKKYDSANEALKAESDKFVSGLTSNDFSKINPKMAFSGKNKEKEAAVMDSIARINPGLVSDITKNMNGAQKKEFSDDYSGMLAKKLEELRDVNINEVNAVNLQIKEKRKIVERLRNSLEGAKKMTDNQNEIKKLQDDLDKETRELDEKMRINSKLAYIDAQKKFKKNMSNQAFGDFFNSETK